MVRLLAALLVLIGLAAPVAAPADDAACPPAILQPGTETEINLAPFACVLVDESRGLTLNDVLAPDRAADFLPVARDLVDFGFSPERFWVRVDLVNPAPEPATWWVTHDMPTAEDIRVFLLPEGGAAQTLLSLTARDGFDARPIPYRHLASEIRLEADARATLVVAYRTDQATEMPLFAETALRFYVRTQGETAQILALTALILGMGLISTVYLYSLEGKRALIYGAYVLGGAIVLLHMEGYAFQYLWPAAPAFNQIAFPVSGLLTLAFGVLFISYFTEASRGTPRLHGVALGGAAFLIAYAGLAPFLMQTLWYKLLLLLTILSATLFAVFLSGVAFRRRRAGSGMLLVGFGALCLSAMVTVTGYLTTGLFPQEWAGTAIRFGFLVEALAFSAAIALRILAARRERNASLKAQLRLSEERLHLSEALRRAEIDRQRAADVAQRSREALASAAHDIRQPLASIQMALSGGEAARERIEGSLTYLDGILRASLEEQNLPAGTGDTDPPMQGAEEHFSADIILMNIDNMFRADADRQGTVLRIVPNRTKIVADPLSLMRMVGNLVSNAIRHADASRVLVGCRRAGDTLRFEVHDDGIGMRQADLEAYLARGARGDASEGHGLGLAIVRELAERRGIAFDLTSHPGRGTCARMYVPCAPSLKRPRQAAQTTEEAT